MSQRRGDSETVERNLTYVVDLNPHTTYLTREEGCGDASETGLEKGGREEGGRERGREREREREESREYNEVISCELVCETVNTKLFQLFHENHSLSKHTMTTKSCTINEKKNKNKNKKKHSHNIITSHIHHTQLRMWGDREYDVNQLHT